MSIFYLEMFELGKAISWSKQFKSVWIIELIWKTTPCLMGRPTGASVSLLTPRPVKSPRGHLQRHCMRPLPPPLGAARARGCPLARAPPSRHTYKTDPLPPFVFDFFWQHRAPATVLFFPTHGGWPAGWKRPVGQIRFSVIFPIF
jgi:hypothetical protein